jgi:hypothetical protein
VVGGVASNVATASYGGGGSEVWFDVEVTRNGTGTTVKANGATLFDNVSQSEHGAGKVGLVSTFAEARFDNVELATLWSCSFEGTAPAAWEDCGLFEQKKEEAVTRATLVEPGRDGAKAVQLHTEPGDTGVAGSGSAERNDLALSQQLSDGYSGRQHWWAHSLRLPDTFVFPDDWYVLADFHHVHGNDPQPGQANFQVQVDPDGTMRMRGFGGSCLPFPNNPSEPCWNQMVFPADGAIPDGAIGLAERNKWYDFVYHVRWSSTSTGFFRAWVRIEGESTGRLVLAHCGPTLYQGWGMYFKVANYHAPLASTDVIHDRVIRGVSAADVSLMPLEAAPPCP